MAKYYAGIQLDRLSTDLTAHQVRFVTLSENEWESKQYLPNCRFALYVVFYLYLVRSGALGGAHQKFYMGKRVWSDVRVPVAPIATTYASTFSVAR